MTNGKLLLVDDNKNVLGIKNDLKLLKKQNDDGFQLKITEIISNFIGKVNMTVVLQRMHLYLTFLFG